jgi:hypothetical protein
MLSGLNDAVLVAETELLNEIETDLPIGQVRQILSSAERYNARRRVYIATLTEGSIIIECLAAVLSWSFVSAVLKGPWEKSETKAKYDAALAKIIDQSARKVGEAIDRVKWKEKGLVITSRYTVEEQLGNRLEWVIHVSFRRATPNESPAEIGQRDQ